MTQDTGIKNLLELFVVVLKDDSFEQPDTKREIANDFVIVSSTSYLIFDARNASERTRVPAQKAIEQMRERAFARFGEYIDELIADNDRQTLEDLSEKLTHNSLYDKIMNYLGNKGLQNGKINI